MVVGTDPARRDLNRARPITGLKREVGPPDCLCVPASHFILLIEDDPSSSDVLATHLVRLGVEPIRVESLSEAANTVKSKLYSIRAVLLPMDLRGTDIKNALKSMRRREPLLQAMAYGKSPDPTQRLELQKAGVLLALWDGYGESVLRFQLNRLLTRDAEHSIRSSRRAPTQNPIRIRVGGREKEGILYSMSEGGCFIKTKKASMQGAHLQLVFRLADVDYHLYGTVAFANVPGNLQRPNLPLGMGVRFDDMPDPARWQLADFIRERLDALEI